MESAWAAALPDSFSHSSTTPHRPEPQGARHETAFECNAPQVPGKRAVDADRRRGPRRAVVGVPLALDAKAPQGANAQQRRPRRRSRWPRWSQRDVASWDEFSGRLEAVERVDIRPRVPAPCRRCTSAKARWSSRAICWSRSIRRRTPRRSTAPSAVVAAQARLTYTTERARARASACGTSAPSRSASSTSAHNAQREADANLRAAQAALQSAQLNLGYTQVRAPVAGRVGKLEVTVGNLVAAGPSAPVLTTLVSVNPIYASFDADEQIVTRALKDLHGGASARSRSSASRCRWARSARPDTPYRGHLQLVDNQVDANSGTVRVRAVFDNEDGALMPGPFARLRMGQAEDGAALADQRARGRHRSEQEVRARGRRRQQGGVPRGDARPRRSTACASSPAA